MIDEGALIGGRERREIAIVAYDPRWPAQFERERALVSAALGPLAIAIEHVGFRDRLRGSQADREEYERLKRELALREWQDMNAYADAKGPLIEAILARAGG